MLNRMSGPGNESLEEEQEKKNKALKMKGKLGSWQGCRNWLCMLFVPLAQLYYIIG
mgnify:CR=1 FL=1